MSRCRARFLALLCAAKQGRRGDPQFFSQGFVYEREDVSQNTQRECVPREAPAFLVCECKQASTRAG